MSEFEHSGYPHQRLQSALNILQALSADSASRLPSGYRRRVVLAGLPNAGKSTLFNRLIGQQKAIVSPIAGTTRDYLTATLRLDSLELELLVCVLPGHFRSDVQAGLLAVLGSRVLPDGSTGLFHADQLSFGQTVYLSQIYAAARQVTGVASVNATVFQRQGIADPQYLQDGFMRLARLEIPRLDNDANFPEHGVLRVELHGGK